MNENLDPDAIQRLLNRSLTQLDQATVVKLQQARQQALQHATGHAPVPIMTWISAHVRQHPAIKHHSTATWLAAALLIIGLLGGAGYVWQQSYDNNDEVDIAILTDDLPINYYVD